MNYGRLKMEKHYVKNVTTPQKEENQEWIYHNDCLSLFTERLYENIFTKENIKTKKKCIPIDGEKYYGYFLEKNKETFFIQDDGIKGLPFRIDKALETDYKGDVFKVITEFTSIKIPSEKKMSFRELVNNTPSFTHTNPLHFLLYKIVAISSYIDRLNARISTDQGFGKDSVVNIIQQLVNSTVNIYGATFAKLEFSLINKLIILNEMGNLKKDDKINMQEFLLATGDFSNDYTKRTRKTLTTQEQYNISKLSLLIFYNLPQHYIGKAQEFFDQLFTKAVIRRFIPFYFKGNLTTEFEKIIDIKQIVDKNEQNYKDVIATLNYFREHIIKEIKYDIPTNIEFSDKLKRYGRVFNTLLKYISEYAESQEEFNTLSLELFKCYKNYSKLLVTERKGDIK